MFLVLGDPAVASGRNDQARTQHDDLIRVPNVVRPTASYVNPKRREGARPKQMQEIVRSHRMNSPPAKAARTWKGAQMPLAGLPPAQARFLGNSRVDIARCGTAHYHHYFTAWGR